MAKRLVRDGAILAVPRSKDKTYLYANNPPMIHTQSSKINHYLGLADIYIRVGCPDYFHIEHHIENGAYIPDAIARIKDQTVVIELQRSVISESKMQDKVNNFVKYYSCHGSKHLWIFTDKEYKLRVPPGFHIEQKKMTPTLR